MINSLSEFLVLQGYKKIKLKLTKTNHFEIKAKINNVKVDLSWTQVHPTPVLVLTLNMPLNSKLKSQK